MPWNAAVTFSGADGTRAPAGGSEDWRVAPAKRGARLDVREGMAEGCHACMEISATGHADANGLACAAAEEVGRG